MSSYCVTKCHAVSVINGYHVSYFNENNSDVAFILRIIEISHLNKLENEAERLFSLTGLIAPSAGLTVDEMNALLKRCKILRIKAEEELSYLDKEVNDASRALENVRISASRTIRSAAQRAEQRSNEVELAHRLKAATTRSMEQSERLDLIKSLPGFLAGQAKELGKGIDKSLLVGVTLTPALQSNIHNFFSDIEFSREIKFIYKVLSELLSAVRNIIKNCTIPTDKYSLSHGGEMRAMAYRYYYREDNVMTRIAFSESEYIDIFMKYNHVSEVKNKIYSY